MKLVIWSNGQSRSVVRMMTGPEIVVRSIVRYGDAGSVIMSALNQRDGAPPPARNDA
jgi:hypothetical protein